MLLTTCPNCAAQFKVQPEQLNVRQGRVMCGRCRQVFDAFQSLTRIEDSPSVAPGPPDALPEAAVSPAPSPPDEPTDSLFLRAEPATIPELYVAGESIPPESRVDQPGRADASGENIVEEAVPSPLAPGDSADDAPVEQAPPLPPGLILDAENPLLAEPTPQYRPAPAFKAPWSLMAIMLALGLLAQIGYAFRSQISQQFPATRPSIVAICDLLGCSVPRGREESAIRIEASDLVEAPGRTGRILLTVTVVNRSGVHQEFPALELRLTDSANQAVLSRVFMPSDYLGRAVAREESIAPGGETFVNMQIELPGRPPASGYGVRAFYP